MTDATSGWPNLSAVRRKRVEQCYDRAAALMEKSEYDFNYAGELLGQCVGGDPSNPAYLDKFLVNLYRKYKDKSKISKLAGLTASGPRNATKKALAAKDWESLAKHAVEALKVNPWDAAPLSAFATMCEHFKFDKSEIRALKAALEASRDDPEINKQAAIAAARFGEYDQAIACWHRVEKAKPNDEESPRAIQELTLRKTLGRSGPAEDRKAGSAGAGRKADFSPEDLIKQKIIENPQDLDAYLELAQYYNQEERFRDAEAAMVKAVQVSDGRPDIKERLEDAQLTNLQDRIRKAELKARASKADADVVEYQRLRKKLKHLEVEVYKARVDRYPANLGFKHELGLRYQAVGEYNEAIKMFQLARNDPRRKGLCLFALGVCFQQIKQPRLAMRHYEEAVQEIPDREEDAKKQALYYAGRLALGLKDQRTANKHLTTLAQLDFGYKDVAALLDKVEQLDQDSGTPPASEPEGE